MGIFLDLVSSLTYVACEMDTVEIIINWTKVIFANQQNNAISELIFGITVPELQQKIDFTFMLTKS